MLKKALSMITIVCILFSLFVVNGSAQDLHDQKTNTSKRVNNSQKFKEIKPSELIIKYKDGTSSKDKSNLENKIGARLVKSGKNGSRLLRVNDNNIEKHINSLKKDKNIEYIVPNYIRKAVEFPADAPNDPEFINQWGLKNINAREAWSALESTSTLEEVKVAVIDTGLDMNHEDLKDMVSHDGYDFVDMDNDPSPGPVYEEHASHVAGIIAASTDNGLGVAGTVGKAPIKIMPLRVLNAGSGDDFTVAQAIFYAADNGAKVINMSLGGPMESEYLNEAVNYALSKNVVVVAAAGNSSSDAAHFHPAAIPGVVSVSATNSSDEPAVFTNYGAVVELAAPGVDVISTIPGNGYEYYDGTSMAAPFVSAASALLISKNPALTNIEIEQILTESSKDLGSEGKDEKYGYGLLDLGKALSIEAPKAKFEILNLLDNTTVFDIIDVQTRFTYPENITKTELYIDGVTLDSIDYEPGKSIYSFEVDTYQFEDGIHTLKAVAYDKSNQTYEKELKINIRNHVYTGLRVKLTDKGVPVEGGSIEVWHQYTLSNGETACDLIYWDMTRKNGIANIPGSIAPNGNEYFIVANYGVINGQTLTGAVQVKKAVAPGIIEINESDLVSVKVNTGIRDTNMEIFANYKLPGTEKYFECYMGQALAGETEVFLNPGTYTFEAFSYNFEPDTSNKPAYLLKTSETTIDDKNNEVRFVSNRRKLAKLDVSLKGIEGFTPTSGVLLLSYGNSQFLKPVFIDDLKRISDIYITPGDLKYTLDMTGLKDNITAGVCFEGSSDNLRLRKNTKLEFGGGFSGKLLMNKNKFIPGETVLMDTVITDRQGNRLIYVNYLYEDPWKELRDQKAVLYRKGTNKLGLKYLVNDQDTMAEPWEFEFKSPITVDLIDKNDNIVASRPDFSFNSIFELGQDLTDGKYTLRVTTELPCLIQADAKLSVTTAVRKDVVKLKIGLPEDTYAQMAYVEGINIDTGEVFYHMGYNLVDGEMYLPLAKGNYRLFVNSSTSEGIQTMHVKELTSPGEYELKASELQRVKLSTKDSDGNIINSPSMYYFNVPGAQWAWSYYIGFNELSSETEVFMQKGQYNIGVSIIKSDYSALDRAIFKEEVQIGSTGDLLENIVIESNDLTEMALGSESDSSYVIMMVTDKKTGLSAAMPVDKANMIKISKGSFDLRILSSKESISGTYSYETVTSKEFSEDTTYINCGTDFSISVNPDKETYLQGEILKTDNIISDKYQNRLVSVWSYDSFGMFLNTMKSMKGRYLAREANGRIVLLDTKTKDQVEMPYYDIRAPFMYITDAQTGNRVFSAKSPYFYTSSEISLDLETIQPGQYSVELTVDIGPNGNISAKSDFEVR
ncbi:MAG: S8 family serine peptidase [Bacillota bacterium]